MRTEVSQEFADGLRAELPLWANDGLVSEGTARLLAARYGVHLGRVSGAGRARTARFGAAAAVAVLLTLASALLVPGIGDGVLLPLTALAAAFAAAPLVVHGPQLARAAEGVRTLGRVLFYAFAYALSFNGVADAARFEHGLASQGLVAALPPLLLAVAAVATGHRRPEVDPHARGEAMLLTATTVAFAAGLSLDSGNGTALVATMSLAFLAVGRIVRGMHFVARGPYVEGVAVAAIVVASRAYDVFPSLWISVAFAALVLGGAVVAVATFERKRARAAPARVPTA